MYQLSEKTFLIFWGLAAPSGRHCVPQIKPKPARCGQVLLIRSGNSVLFLFNCSWPQRVNVWLLMRVRIITAEQENAGWRY